MRNKNVFGYLKMALACAIVGICVGFGIIFWEQTRPKETVAPLGHPVMGDPLTIDALDDAIEIYLDRKGDIVGVRTLIARLDDEGRARAEGMVVTYLLTGSARGMYREPVPLVAMNEQIVNNDDADREKTVDQARRIAQSIALPTERSRALLQVEGALRELNKDKDADDTLNEAVLAAISAHQPTRWSWWSWPFVLAAIFAPLGIFLKATVDEGGKVFGEALTERLGMRDAVKRTNS